MYERRQKQTLGFEFCEAILRWGDACPDKRKSVYKSEQALVLSLQIHFVCLLQYVCESEQALLLDSQNLNRQKCLSVRWSEQALLLSLQKLFGLLAPFVCESEQALLLDAQNPCWGISPNPTFFLKRK